MSYTYQYEKDGTPIGGATNATLALTAIDSSDDGQYEIAVTNGTKVKRFRPSALTVQMFDVYVDSVAGNDANDGDTAAAPLATLAAAKTAAEAIGNGAKVGLKRGSYWREDFDLGAIESGVIEGYGTGTLPTIDGAKIVVAGDWTKTGGRTNVYEYGMTQVPSLNEGQAWEDGDVLQYVADVAAVDSTAGSYTVTGTKSGYQTVAGPVTFYIHPRGSTNPTSDGKVYEVSDMARLGATRLGANGRACELFMRRPCNAIGAFRSSGNNITLEYCYVTEGVRHETILSSGIMRHVVGWHPANDPRTSNIILEFYSGNGTELTCVYDHCIAIGPGASTSHQSCAGISGHNQGPGTIYKSQTITDCVVLNCQTGYASEAVDSVTMTRCFADDCRTAIATSMADDTGQYTLIDCGIRNVTYDLYIGVYCQDHPVSIDGLRAYTKKGDSIGVVYNTYQTRFTNSSIFASDNLAKAIRPQVSNPDLYVRNVVSEQTAHWIIQGTAGGTIDTDGNVLFPSTMDTQYQATSYLSVAAYLAAVQPGNESTTQATDPDFVDPANMDFTIQTEAIAGKGCARPNIQYGTVPSASEILALMSSE